MQFKISKSNKEGKFLKLLAQIILRMMGWKTEGRVPDVPKYVMIGYPHTSNWDTFIGLVVFKAMGVRLHWVGKHTLFKPPLGWFIRLMGGVPVDRKDPRDFVQQMIDVYNASEELVLTLSPEGTRKKPEYWKTGFYRIAKGANVPIALAFLDYSRKVGGFGPLIYPSDDLEKDIKIIQKFYAPVKGKFPELQSEIRIKPKENAQP